MADGDIDAGGGRLLPGDLRGLLGLPAPTMPVPDPQNLYAPPTPMPQPIGLPSAVEPAPQPELPPQGPNLGTVDTSGPKPKLVPPKPAPAPKPQPAPAPALRMPTLAETTALQQQAAHDELEANAAATGTAVQQAQDIHTINQQATTDLQQSIKAQQEWQAKSDKVRADKEAAASAAMREVDSYKIDPNRYWNEGGTAKKVGWLVAMALSGLGDALQHKSGPNPVIGMLDAAIDRDIKLQMDKRDQLKEKLGRAEVAVDKWDRFSANRDAQFLAQRAQAKELVAQQLMTAASKYGSEAAIANGAKTAADIRKSAAKDLQTSVDMAHGHAMQEEQVKIAKQNAAIAGGHLALASKQFEWSKEREQAQMAIEVAKLQQTGQAKEAEELRKFGVMAPPELVKDENGKTALDEQGMPKVAPARPLTQADGSMWKASDEKQKDAFAGKVAKAHEVVDIINEVESIRDGASAYDKSSWSNSPAYQRLAQLQARLAVLAKEGTEGMSSDEDMKRLSETLSADDLTKFRSLAAGLDSARSHTLSNLNIQARDRYGYTGKPFEFANRWGSPAATADSQKLETVLGTGPSTASKVANTAGWVALPVLQGGRKLLGRATESAPDALKVSNADAQVIDTWRSGLSAPDKATRDRSEAFLRQVAANANDADTRAYAQSALQRLNSLDENGRPLSRGVTNEEWRPGMD